jgi:hypothetical protein
MLSIIVAGAVTAGAAATTISATATSPSASVLFSKADGFLHILEPLIHLPTRVRLGEKDDGGKARGGGQKAHQNETFLAAIYLVCHQKFVHKFAAARNSSEHQTVAAALTGEAFWIVPFGQKPAGRRKISSE